MAFSLSPAVTVREIDLSAVVSSASSTLSAFAGLFNWGPVNEPMLISDEAGLVKQFGYPSDYNATDFFTIASFFAYSSGAWVTRIGNNDMVNANLTFGAPNKIDDTINILNSNEFSKEQLSLDTVSLVAKYPGIIGNAISVAYCSNVDQYSLDLLESEFKDKFELKFQDAKGLAIRSKEIPFVAKAKTRANPMLAVAEIRDGFTVTPGVDNSSVIISYKDDVDAPATITTKLAGGIWSATNAEGALNTEAGVDNLPWIDPNTGIVTVPAIQFSANDTTITLISKDLAGKEVTERTINTNEAITDYMKVGDFINIDGIRYYIAGLTEDTVVFDRIYVGRVKPESMTRYWKYATEFSKEPVKDGFHLVLIDNIGYFMQRGSVLESYENISIDSKATDAIGQSAFWRNVLNKKSAFVYAGGVAPDMTQFSSEVYSLKGGDNAEATVGLDEYIKGYNIYLNAETYDTPIMIGGNAIKTNDVSGAVLANYLIYSIAEVRKDTFVLLSPPLEAVLDNVGREALDCVKARNIIGSSSYASMDCNWKYMYDRYNDTYRWVPTNGDIAGLMAQTDRDRDAWVSPAGTTRGRLKNIVKLAWNPDKTARDILYPNDVNPIVNLPIAGHVLFGDKTLLGKNTALSRINVRRLLIILEKAIATAALDLLFEFNDEFTQRRFVSMVTPLLNDVKNRRGLTAFKVIADSSVNTPQVVQNNGFVGRIFIKPNYTINSIRLDFVVVNASASFEEVIGIQ